MADNVDESAEVINQKANSCPMAVRLAWHASGTYSKYDGTGGSDGATMRFEPESADGANAGLNIERDILLPCKKAFPELSYADIWTLAGSVAIEFCGGPEIDHIFGRVDAANGGACPAVGRLPDAAQGAAHLRDVFYRMGFNDEDIVALSGAHTLGRCHKTRSGFDGPWTGDPLTFDNTYFKNLMDREWQLRDWDGPQQYEDIKTKSYMMLPTDMALKTDNEFKKHARKFADSQDAFFKSFKKAYEKLLSLGCPSTCQPDGGLKKPASLEEKASRELREHCMHGSLEHAQTCLTNGADPKSLEANSGRTALHKAAFWGHDHIVPWLLRSRCPSTPSTTTATPRSTMPRASATTSASTRCSARRASTSAWSTRRARRRTTSPSRMARSRAPASAPAAAASSPERGGARSMRDGESGEWTGACLSSRIMSE